MERPSFACASSRAAIAPRSQSGKKYPTNCSRSGSGVTRTVACVITPMRPSEPSIHSRRSGPAAEAGKVGMSSVPVGVSTRAPANIASMRP